MQGQYVVEFWGGPCDGRVQAFDNPTTALMIPVETSALDVEAYIAWDQVVYDFDCQLPSGVLLYRVRKEVVNA